MSGQVKTASPIELVVHFVGRDQRVALLRFCEHGPVAVAKCYYSLTTA